MAEASAGAGVHGVRSLLAVFAHPDDEVLCAGGTLALCRALGQRVTLVCATRGELGPVSDPALIADASLAEVRERELRASCAQLGVEDVRLLGLPDAELHWRARTQEVVGELVLLLRTLRPDVLVTFGADGLYGHFDHVAIGEVVVEARAAAADATCFPEQLAAGHAPHAVRRLFFPVLTGVAVARALAAAEQAGLMANLWSLSASDFLATESEVSARVDVGSVLAAKLRALRSHRTQLQPDNLLRCMTPAIATDLLGVECFRCADGLAGDPISG